MRDLSVDIARNENNFVIYASSVSEMREILGLGFDPAGVPALGAYRFNLRTMLHASLPLSATLRRPVAGGV